MKNSQLTLLPSVTASPNQEPIKDTRELKYREEKTENINTKEGHEKLSEYVSGGEVMSVVVIVVVGVIC